MLLLSVRHAAVFAIAQLLRSQGANVFCQRLFFSRETAAFESPFLHLKRLNLKSASIPNMSFIATIMVISPGVPGNAPIVLEAQRRNIKIVMVELEASTLVLPVASRGNFRPE